MHFIKRALFRPLTLILITFLILYWDFFAKGLIPIPADTLIGSYHPWLDYKWGYSVGVPVKNALISDVFSQFFLWKQLAADFLRKGVLPLWNPFSFAGTPLLANYHSGTLFPAALLLFLPKNYGWGLYISLSTLAAMLSMYIFLTTHIRRSLARVTASIVFGLAGPMTTWTEFGTAVWAASLIPLVFWCVDNAISQRKGRFLFGLTLTSCLLFLAGHAQLSTYLVVLLSIYAWINTRSPNAKTFFPKICFALLSAVGLAAIQLIPTIDFFRRSIRSEESYASTFNYGLTPLSQFVRLWVADFFGNPTTGNSFGSISYHEFSSFLGTITLPLVLPLLLIRRKHRHPQGFFIALFLLSLGLSLDNPLSRFIFSLPLPLLTYSSASRLLFLTVFAAAFLLANSLEMLDRPNFRKKVVASSLLLLLIIAISLLLVDSQHRAISLKNSLLPVVILLSLSAVFLTKIKKDTLIFLLLLVTVFDLARYFKKYNPFVSQNLIFPDTPITDFLQHQPGTFRIARQYGPVLPPNTWTYYRLEAIEGYDPLRLLSYNRLFHLAEDSPYFSKASRYSELIHLNPKFLDLLNVKYFVAVDGPPTPEIQALINYGYKPVFADKQTLVYENPKFAQRAFFINRLTVVPDETSLAHRLESPDFIPTEEAVVISQASPTSEFSTAGQITDIAERPNGLTLSLNTPKEAFLLISNSYDTGWKAAIDNRDAPVIPTDGALQGLLIPAGSHRITLNYLPESITIGSIVSLLSLGATAVFLKTIKV